MSKAPKPLPSNRCLTTNWADLDGLLAASPVELASRALWEGMTKPNVMSPLMWALEEGGDKSLTNLRYQATEMAGRPSSGGCFLFHQLEDPAKSLQLAYRERLWGKAYELALLDKVLFLLMLAKERFSASHFIDPKSDETMETFDLMLQLEEKQKQGRKDR